MEREKEGGRGSPAVEAAAPRLGVLFSGGGRTLENLARRIEGGSLPGQIVIAIASHAEAGGIGKARRLGIRSIVIDYRVSGPSFSEEITGALGGAEVDLVLLAGFIRHYHLPADFEGKVLNIHPALLPAFGGKGFYGDRVHRAVLEAGVKFTGCTVHFVTEEYDQGPIILQRIVPVHPGDSVRSLADRVFAEECIAYPEAIRLHAEKRLEVRDGRVLLKRGAEGGL